MARADVVRGMGVILLLGAFGCGGYEADEPEADGARLRASSYALDDGGEKKGKKPCQPTAGGPYWVKEGETLEVKLSCATGEHVKGDKFHMDHLPRGAHYDKKTATLEWTPALNQAAVYTLEIRGPDKEEGSVKIGVADNWEDPDNVPVVDVSRYTEEYGLPVFHIQGAGAMNPDAHVPITVTYRGHEYAAEGKLRGSSSLAFPKNSYTVKFSDTDPFNEPEKGGGFTGKRSLVLINTFNDNSYVRARLGFELWNHLSPQAIQIQTFSAVVFLDGAYHGLYTVVDHVNKNLMAAQGLSRNGNLYKADTGGANFKLVDANGQPKPSPHAGFEKQDGKPEQGQPGAFDDLDAIVTFVATASDEEFRTQGPQRINLRDYEDWWAFVTLLVAIDSDIKNAYHYHDPQGGPWRYIPWDLDGTFGQTWKTQRLRPTAALDTGAENGMFGRILGEPTLAGPLRARLKAALYAELNPPLLSARLDELVQEVGPSARRDELRWGEQYRSFPLWSFRTDYTTFDQEVEYLRQWVVLRWAFLDSSLALAP
ncbi:CotH kinase family protein [Pyxidicoccus parkwayensis]|uniref:CotH kinase family protein n=1 Tax=Pyxidicoccus parkwayensis TaxID=2813578 RepID=A0ABX7NWP6_9BACT|nr:CotH kinase family protein [Pyxidicoccus parkwaysis]QSQ23307.1 CotH kinase family protein [Pyxidicoccus parkwaysis]